MMPRFYFALLLAFVSLAACAQEPAKPPKTLAAALAQVNWNPQRQGAVLLVVAPERAAAHPADAPPPELMRQGYELNALAAYYGRLRQRLGTVVTLAPPTITVLNTHLGPPDLISGLKRDELMRYLMASLTPAQWKQIGSPDGLGTSAMTDEQRALFDKMLPNPMVVDKTNTYYVGRKSDPAKTFYLTPVQRADVRLRVVMQTDADAPLLSRSGRFPVLFQSNRNGGKAEFLDFVGDNPYRRSANPFGQPLSNDVPNKLKPGDLPFNAPALAVSVSLNGPPTVGALITRIGAAAHLELYADKRIQALSVFSRGDTAPAGDILKAICLDIGGAIRQVGPAFVLTYDRVGLASQRAVIDDWQNGAQTQLDSERKRLDSKVKAARPQQYAQWADDEPLKLSPALFAQITTPDKKTGKIDSHVPLSALTPGQQQFIQAAATALTKENSGVFTVQPDTLEITVGLYQSFVVPGLGEVSGSPLATIAEPRNDTADAVPAVLPPDRTLFVQANTPAEAVRAVSEAAKRGMTRLWLPVTLGGDMAPLQAAIKAGKLRHLPVLAVARLLSRPPGSPDADINVLGQTLSVYTSSRPTQFYGEQILAQPAPRDWARLDQPGLAETLQQPLVRLAKTLGLAGLVLRDTAAPGFDRQKPSMLRVAPGGGAAESAGCTLAPRLAFLRRYSADPIDIDAIEYRVRSDAPFFEEPDDAGSGSLTAQWTQFCYQGNMALLGRLYEAVRRARPALPLWAQAQQRMSYTPYTWYSVWTKPAAPPTQENIQGGYGSQSLAPFVRPQFRPVLISTAGENVVPETVLSFASEALLTQGKDSDGIIFDGSALPLKDGLALIDNLKIDPARR